MKAPQSIFSVITVNCPGIWAPDIQMEVFLRTSPSSFSFCSAFLSWCQNLPILLMIPKRQPLWWAHLPSPSPPPAHAYSSLGEGPLPSLLLLWVTRSGLWTQSGSQHQQGPLLTPTSQKSSFLIPIGIPVVGAAQPLQWEFPGVLTWSPINSQFQREPVLPSSSACPLISYFWVIDSGADPFPPEGLPMAPMRVHHAFP